MSIRFVAKPEVSDVVGLIHRLHHRANQHSLKQMVIGTLSNLLEHGLVVARRRLEPAAHVQSHFTQKRAQILELVGVGPLVHAIQRRQLCAFEKERRRHVGAQHTLLDKLVRVVAVNRHDLRDFAILAEDNARLRRVEVHRAISLARLAQRMKQPVETD